MRRERAAAGLGWILPSAFVLSSGVALGQPQITFQANATLYRIAVQPGALPEDLSALLDAIATQPGSHAGPITASPDGGWYVFHSGRFDAGCAGSNACLTLAPSDISSAETIRVGGNPIYGEGGIALPGGNAVVYSDGGAAHARDLWIVTRQGGVWTGPVLLTGASGFDFNYAPALSPDGTKVIFDAGPSPFPSTAVCQVGVDGTGFQVLVTNTDGPPPPFGPSPAARSGSRAPDLSLAFEAEWVSGGGFSERIWRLPAGGGTPVLVNGAFTNDNSPCVLPDGRIASLYLGGPPPSDGLHEIKIMDADGTNDFLLTTNGFIPGFTEVDDVGMGCAPAAGGPPAAGPFGELVHGSEERRDLAALPGPTVAEGLFHVHQDPRASYEIVVDGTGGDLGTSGPSLERVNSGGVLQSSAPIGAGSSRSLRFENASGGSVDDQWIRVRSNGCSTSCGPEAVYRIRGYETTYRIARFNNSGTQVSVLVVQNTSGDVVTGNAWFRDAAGGLVGSQPLSLSPHQELALNTAGIAPNTSGAITISNDGRYGCLEGKAVAVEPATGFSFDTPLLPRPR